MAKSTAVRGADHKRAGTAARILLIGERFLLIDALRAALTNAQMVVAAIGNNRHDIDTAINALSPDVLIFDASQSSVTPAVRAIRSLVESGRTVGAIAAEGISVEAALLVDAGAQCVLGLDSGLDELANTVDRFLVSGSPLPLDRRYALQELLREHRNAERGRWLLFDELTRRERDILSLVYEGMSATQIADDVCVSVSTVRSHIRNILNKLNVNSQLAAVAMARSRNWFASDSADSADSAGQTG